MKKSVDELMRRDVNEDTPMKMSRTKIKNRYKTESHEWFNVT